MSPHLTPHKSSHGPSPTPINLDRDSPNGTMAHTSSHPAQSQPVLSNESPRKNSISGSGPEWIQDYDDALPVKGLFYLLISFFFMFIYYSRLLFLQNILMKLQLNNLFAILHLRSIETQKKQTIGRRN